MMVSPCLVARRRRQRRRWRQSLLFAGQQRFYARAFICRILLRSNNRLSCVLPGWPNIDAGISLLVLQK